MTSASIDEPAPVPCVVLVQAESDAQWATARRLVEAYAASLPVDLGFQDFQREVSHLAQAYGPPDGAFLLARREDDEAGCVGLRRFVEGVCETKRLYVVPVHRGHGVGRALAEGVVAQARRLGYRRMLLDILEAMKEAQALYASLGFRPTAAYRDNPVPNTSFLELPL
jgi:GNAT superfamily N-acetyltransferase